MDTYTYTAAAYAAHISRRCQPLERAPRSPEITRGTVFIIFPPSSSALTPPYPNIRDVARTSVLNRV